jgi:hypothetical protein
MSDDITKELMKEKYKDVAMWDVIVKKKMYRLVGVDGMQVADIAQVVPTTIHSNFVKVLITNVTYEQASVLTKIHNLGETDGTQ